MFVSLPLVFIDQTLLSCGFIAWLKSEMLLKCGCILTIELCRLSKHLTGPIRPERLSQDQGLSLKGVAVAMVTRMVIVMCFLPDVIVTSVKGYFSKSVVRVYMVMNVADV